MSKLYFIVSNQAEEKRNAERDGDDEECSPTAVGVPGLRPGTDRRPPPETLQRVVQFQREQVEEKQVGLPESKQPRWRGAHLQTCVSDL